MRALGVDVGNAEWLSVTQWEDRIDRRITAGLRQLSAFLTKLDLASHGEGAEVDARLLEYAIRLECRL